MEDLVNVPFDRFRFIWKIEHFSTWKKKQYSEIFTVGGYKWRLLIFPKGKGVDQLSLYLDVADSETLPSGWSRYAYFILAVVSQIHPKLTIKKETEHTFNAKKSDSGYKLFIPLCDVHDPTKGYLVDDTLIVEAEVSARRVVGYWACDSRTQTDFVWLKNQGTTGQSGPSGSSEVSLKKEQEEKEKKQKENAEAHLYIIIKVARDADLADQIGKDIYFDLVNHKNVHSFRVQKQQPFTQFKEVAAKVFGVPVQYQRFWLWNKRQNSTYRPSRPLTQLEESQSVGHLRVSRSGQSAELELFLEAELGLDRYCLPPLERKKDDILVFFKRYDPDEETLRYVGRSFVKLGGKPKDSLMKLNEMAGFPPDTIIELYEEIKSEPRVMCLRIDERISFESSQIGDGDIICFQRALKTIEAQRYRYPYVNIFLQYIHEQQAAGGKARQVGLHGREREGEDLLERPELCKRVEGTCEGDSRIVQHKGVVPEAPRGVVGEVMTVEQIENVLGDITRGLVPTDLEDPRWPSSAGRMTRTFASTVRLADEFRALKGEVERLRIKEAVLSEVMRLSGRGEGGAGP